MIQKFRKKPVVIEAVQIHKCTDTEDVTEYLKRNAEIEQWCGGVAHMLSDENDPHFIIHTLEGDMKASPNDFIIKGVNGELYPCKPDIFAKTYEPA